ncbi:MAG: SDR family NAD(P)-dependent oxidoreductase [Clostridia bacterium]|nr:SDR family NAD(P)-dependent oxidoreductase [Clostridia bacterium]
MLNVLFNYANGYIAVPVILACKTHGLFKKLDLEKPVLFTDLVKELQANSGYLRVALHILESLNWILRNDNDEYLLTPEAYIHLEIPETIIELMSFPMKDYLNKNQKKYRLRKWIELSSRGWDTDNPMLANFLDGMLVIPLLSALKDNNLLNSPENQKILLSSELNPVARKEIIELFINKGWISQKDGSICYTDEGCFIMDRIFITAIEASYKPVLNNISKIIFGDCKGVIEQDLSKNGMHAGYTLNIIRSAFQDEKYFSDLEEIILSIFNRKPFTEQPKYVVDMGCGDGRLLKKIYEVIKNKSLRGKVLHEHPVKLIGIDINEKALEETVHTLKDIDHIVLKGDIGEPEKVIVDLKNIGAQDAESILYVRSFLAHDRRYIPPSDDLEAIARSNTFSKAVHVDEDGNEIPSSFVVQSLVESFKQWVKVTGRHGLLILEEHCLEPKILRQFVDRCESLHFDALHRLSRQPLVEAEQFLMAAAEAGLFPNQDFFRKYPRDLSFSRFTLNHFECREYSIRYMQERDLPALEELEKQCWEPDMQVSISGLKKRWQIYPQGQLVLEMNNKVVGVIYSRRITSLETLRNTSFEDGDKLHRKDGATVQLLAVNILPELQHQNLGDQLLEFMLQRCSFINGIHSVVAVTRCKDYYRHSNLTIQEYISLRNGQGRLSDTILRFHELHGAQVRGLLPNYRIQDTKNQGCGVLVEYYILNRRRNEIQVEGGYQEKGVGVSAGDKTKILKDFVVKSINAVLGKTKEEEFALDRPLMEMGLDSTDLLELNEQISSKYQIHLEPAFFFKYRTAESIIAYLLERVYPEEVEEVTENREITIAGLDKQKGRCETKEADNFMANPAPSKKDIAIIGIACRLPGGVRNKEQLWELLAEGRDAIGNLPEQRLNWPDNIDIHSSHKGINRVGLLNEITGFDSAFFRISPKDAELMDPQQRILLELSWECLETAGYPAKALFGSKTGVFIGASGSDYNNRLIERGTQEIEAHYGVGISMSILANRISYFYDFNGPSLQIDTACSSSLVAVHEAVKSLQAGECGQALVSGINIICHPANSIAYYKAGMLSKDGRCKTFDKEANGYVRGEGAVMLLLKPLEQALSDQDSVFAVIKGSAVNHGGQASGLTVPNPDKQADLLIEAYKTTGIEPETVGYIEAHGTGTPLGDPIEINGLKGAFSKLSKAKAGIPEPYCGLGSIKTNIGHLEAAAGIAGLLKVVLSMQYKMIPASLNFNEINPHISLDKTPFYIINKNQPWQMPDNHSLRRAGVSSFGSGGTNAHVVLEEAPVIRRQPSKSLPGYIICLSAKTEEALRQKERDLALWLEKEGQQYELADISAALLFGREHFNIRAAYVAGGIGEIREKLKEVLEKGDAEGYFRDVNPKKKKQPQPVYEELGRTISQELLLGREMCRQEYEGKLIVLAELYVKGYNPDWQAISTEYKTLRISLPTYPFERGYYWIPQAEMINEPSDKAGRKKDSAPETQELHKLMTFEEFWQEKALPEISPVDFKTLVCFLSRPENQQTVEKTMQKLSPKTKVIFIAQDGTFAGQDKQRYSVDKTGIGGYTEAFRSIVEGSGTADAVLYLWPLEDRNCISDYYIIVYILQALSRAKLKTQRLILAGQFGNALERCYLESWIGFERSLRLVLPDTQIAVVYGENSGQNTESVIQDWLPRLLSELGSQKMQSSCYQAGKRHICQIKPTTLEPGDSLVKPGGTYLITGGCGRLGFLAAEHLAKTCTVKLILIGRSLNDADKQAKLKDLEAYGSQAIYLQADVSDPDRMKEGLSRARERFGEINGVIHAAGIEGRKSILDTEYRSFQQVLEPKIKGTLVLDEILREEALDFICYFSSSSAVLGDFGSCNYAVGNRFQMAYAHYRNQLKSQGELHGKTVVINWPLWKDGGIKLGEEENAGMYLKSSGQSYLETREGLSAFDRILSQNKTQHLVIVGQPSRVQRFLGLGQQQPVKDAHKAASIPGRGRRPEMKGMNLEQCLEWDIKEQISKLLKTSRDKLYVGANLADFGFDSISLAEMAKLLTAHYGIEITPALFFGHSTIEKLIQYFADQHQQAVMEFYREDVVEQTVETITPMSMPLPKWQLTGKFRFKLGKSGQSTPEPIAIIGISGRFPEARNVDEMWRILSEGREVVKEIPSERFDWRQYYGDPTKEAGKTNCKWCGCIPGVSEFDPMFFEISPREAAGMDPRQRLLLQEAWKALEDAGYGAKHIKNNRIGMFVGVEQGDYQSLHKEKGSITFNNNAILAARLAYFLNLNGPVMAIDTACSSGLVAVHQACMSLRNYESDTMIAAGVNLLLTPELYLQMSGAGMLSDDGKCYVFDKRANGIVPGEAVAVVVLKRLSQAITDGDPIYAVIKGCGINYDGKTNGITAPSGVAQTRLVKEVYDKYRVNPEEIEYIVTHGTGTRLGDPVEINALYDAFKDYTQKQHYCAITSTKTNFGHTLAASGIVSLISLVQALSHETIPASLHCEIENDYIKWRESPFYVSKTAKPWPKEGRKTRTGAVSAFGMSGTNAHAVLQSYSQEEPCVYPEQPPYFLLAFSAKTREALQEKVRDMIAVLQSRDLQEKDLLRVSYTLLEGRQHFSCRLAVVVRDREDAVYVLEQAESMEKLPNLFQGNVSRDFTEQTAMRQCAQDLLKQGLTLQKDRNKYKEVLYALADLYCQGYEVPWNQLYGGMKLSRIHLPTYPFAREHYWASRTGTESADNGRASTSAPKNLLQPLTTAWTALCKIPDKPCGISLRPASDEIIPSVRPINQAHQSSALLPEGVSFLQPGAGSESESANYSQTTVSVESLQEELAASLAEALYMECRDVDLDKKFIDMGLDSGIGVEWIRTINKRYGISISATKVYEYPSIFEFAGFLEKELNKFGQAHQSFALPSSNISLSQLSDAEESEFANYSQTTVSVELLQEELAASLAEALYMECRDVDLDNKFIDMGLDSVIGVEWIRTINKRYGTSISATKVYEYPNIFEFARFLEKELKKSGEGLMYRPYEPTPAITGTSQGIEVNPGDVRKEPVNVKKMPEHAWKSYSSCTSKYDEAVAIVGMSGRYPDAGNLEQYWNNLVDARNSIREIPEYRWDVSKYYDPHPLQKGKIYCKWLGLLEDIEYFDPLFFNIPPTEAEIMDPQHRIFLQEGYKAFEDAGYSRQSLSNRKCGVYLGIMSNEYGMMLYKNQVGITNITGNSYAIGAARIPYFLNLKGPAIPIDTACSSSLVATHLACRALLNREIDMALVGGVSVYLGPESYIGMCAAGMLSPEGQCKTFDNGADGFVPGEGVGALVLKRLKDAEADRDSIYGVIIGSGINQDGKTNGITAPSVSSQIELEREIYEKFDIHPDSISYVEMHGTGTKLGDPIELEALATVFTEKTNQKNYCAIGSVKSNIGHTSAAAGIAGIQKVLLCMKHRKLVPTMNFKNPNEHFNFEESPFYVNTELKSWEVGSGNARRAAVSSFGFSGTNAHIVIEEYRPNDCTARTPVSININNPVLFVLSAKSEEQLKIYAGSMKNFIESHKDLNPADMAYTLQVGREAMDCRLAFLADTIETIVKMLEGFINNSTATGVLTSRIKKDREGVSVFEEDEDAKVLLQTWVQKKKLRKIAELWVKGLKLDWNQLYNDIKPCRISLPAYPFARERYWALKTGDGSEGSSTSLNSAEAVNSLATQKVILIKDWQRKPVSTGTDAQAGLVVVLGTDATAKLASALFEDTEVIRVIQVIHGGSHSSEWISADFYSVASGERLYQHIKNKQKNQKLLGIIDITAYDSRYEQSAAVESGKIAFLQKLIEHDCNEGYFLLQVTHKINDFHIAKTTMQGARLAGLYRMLGVEYKRIESMTMDSDCSLQDHGKLAKQIQDEFFSRNKNLTECCYRNADRYEPRLKVIKTDEDMQKSLYTPEKYDDNDVIIITGGSRGIGASIAEHVVSQGVKNLVIIGKEELPNQSDWKNILENKGIPEIEEKLKRMQFLVEKGVKVHYYSTPLTDQAGISAMVEKIHHDLGPVTGVIHCAGLTSNNPAFFKKTLFEIEAVCEPKMKGLVTLHKALEKDPLTFFILFSSISSVVPTLSAGQSDYAMANAYMDYYASYQAGEGNSYFKSIQWPAWDETGMAAGRLRTPAYAKTGIVSHTTRDGLVFMDIIKRTSLAVSLPCMVIQGEICDQLLEKEIISVKKESGSMSQQKSELWSKTLPGAQNDLRTSIVKWLQEIFKSELKLTIEQLDEGKSFDEYGVDSIILAQLTQVLQEEAGKTIEPALLLEYSTIASLADYFMTSHAEALQKKFRLEIRETAGDSPQKGNISADYEPSETVKEGPLSRSEQVHNGQPMVSKPVESAEDIAVIGLSCRFPGAPGKEAYWELLTQGRSAIKPLPGQRWGFSGNSVYYGGWIDNIDLFDPKFFNINDNDAAVMDPQARLILEESLAAVYDAGYDHQQLSGQKIGVYIGGRSQPYINVNTVLQAPNPILGAGQNYLAANISRFFNFRGPSLVVDTACSSGLTGLQFASDSLRERRIDMALVGAVNILLSPFAHDMFAARSILSKNGEFHIFDKRSGGEVLGEGAGVVMLKRLSDAIKDGNHIYGIIKAVTVNNDGRTLGPGSPNINAQKQVMQEALASSSKKPEDIGYIEVNGGGSPVVDSLEIKALSDIYQLSNNKLASCVIGSVKPNIGHLLLTSGLAGFIRCVLSVYYKQIPPFLSASDPFEYYDFSASRIHFNRKIMSWEAAPGKKRVAAQNSFPDGGTNCHVLIEEFVHGGSYRQRYFPKGAPGMVKKHFPISPVPVPEPSFVVLKEGPEKEAGQHEGSLIKNVWGEIQW